MYKQKKNISSRSTSPLIKGLVGVSLLVFLNFTFAIQYVNLSSYGISLTEIVEEEEEKEEHKHDLLEYLINNSCVILFLTVQIKEQIIETIITEVSTPPPELS